MQKFEEKTLKTEEIFSGKIINLQVQDVELPNGKTSKREIIKHPGAVAVLAITEDGNVVLVEQYRKPMEKSLIEIPAGKLEGNEDPQEAALRELEEETGYACKNIELITSFYTAPGFADELIHLYIATDLKKLENPKSADEDEFVELIEVSLQKASEWIKSGKICDAKTLIAIQYWQLQSSER
ncbi:NUDIX domain-containing protein [Heyndrickxia ginsengihumi]|uniref:ADP-ribose pyrophosphatase n=1 Tax=Heyndrickxia ginsengihumi TaxID=363870 RepID=A0A0A6VHC3_9BACI|nr:NUDIX hydrolase [Heyndrickxia ginsengihumi]KHD86034.1 ADP-ribose pyrophosphatase [Heyndrickxia ginsengihumi]MBE6182918.1 NUDIX hydrolase [Bacillus sp. (in: firmicutes)]MCM3022858.1 NUDIX hydrolase [Heyndrickxia ginsengihumi]NEY20126.1 NUDIX hydrolase [Heyndrickxia ginsengihumi]